MNKVILCLVTFSMQSMFAAEKENTNALLFSAIAKNEHEFIGIALTCGADVNALGGNGITPLMMAAFAGNEDIVEYLLDHGADKAINNIGANKLTALMSAISSKNNNPRKIVSLLLEKGASANMSDNEGNTPLMYAVSRKDKSMVEMLINKADVNARDNNKETALLKAVRYDCIDIAEILIKNNADATIDNKDGLTPLTMAVTAKSKPAVELLLKNEKVNINVQDHEGYTPLMMAVGSGDEDIVALLLTKGANVNITNKANMSPLRAAVSIHQSGIDRFTIIGMLMGKLKEEGKTDEDIINSLKCSHHQSSCGTQDKS